MVARPTGLAGILSRSTWVRAVYTFIRRNTVMELLGLGATALVDLQRRDETFPKPLFPFGTRTPVYLLNEVADWQVQCVAVRDAKEPTNET